MTAAGPTKNFVKRFGPVDLTHVFILDTRRPVTGYAKRWREALLESGSERYLAPEVGPTDAVIRNFIVIVACISKTEFV